MDITDSDRRTGATATDPGPAPVTTVVPAGAVPVDTGFRLRRSPTDLLLGGVCGGLAEELDLDPALVRIAMVALTVLSSGIVALLYLAAWILAPVEEARA